MINRAAPDIVIDKFRVHRVRVFASREEWEICLNGLGLGKMKVTPDPVLIASEAAIWGAIHHQGLLRRPLGETVVVSDDAGQFRVGAHALCWVHAERLVHKLIPANDRRRGAVETAKMMIGWFYQALKDYKLAPSPEQAEILRARFDRIFRRLGAGDATLDKLLRRLFRNKIGLLRVLDRPEIPLHTNGSENDIRAFVTKRKISGGTVSEKGRDSRDILLGLAKTCRKLKLSCYEFIPGRKIPPLATLVGASADRANSRAPENLPRLPCATCKSLKTLKTAKDSQRNPWKRLPERGLDLDWLEKGLGDEPAAWRSEPPSPSWPGPVSAIRVGV